MSACADFDLLVSELAAGALDAEAAAGVQTHLAGCERCRSELDAYRRAFDLARLPPLSDLERRSLASLPNRTLMELRRERVGTPIWKAFSAGFAAAAVVALFIAAPWQAPTGVTLKGPESVAEWQAPDVDELLETVAALEEDDATEGTEPLAKPEQLADNAYAKLVASAD